MNGPDDIRRALGRLALAFAILGFGSVALGIGLAALGMVGGGVMFLGSGSAGGAVGLSAVCIIGGVMLAAGGVPELLTWYGVSKRTSWGRWLGIVLCTTFLAAFPFGTAFGTWGLWVLLSSGGVRAFGLQRSWLGDGAALLAGWFFMPDNDDARSYRVDGRGHRHRRGRHGGRGGLLLLLVIIGVLAFATCGSCLTSFARGVSSSGVATSGVSTSGVWSGIGTGAPAALGAEAGSWLRELGALDAARDAQTLGGPAPAVGMTPSPSVADAPADQGMTPPLPTAPDTGKHGTGQLWVYDDADGATHIVDDVEKIPEALRARARPFK